jgi:hypothetical protein
MIISDDDVELGSIYGFPLFFKGLIIRAICFPRDCAIGVVLEKLGITGHLLGIEKLGLDKRMNVVVSHFIYLIFLFPWNNYSIANA